jgi:deoxyribodipyrimidine photo-lyase
MAQKMGQGLGRRPLLLRRLPRQAGGRNRPIAIGNLPLISPARIKVLVDAPVSNGGSYVLYWMQNAQRASFNPALEYALEQANALDLPLLICFGLTAFPEANARHYDFMLRGLAVVRGHLAKRGIGFVIRKAPPHAVAQDLAADAALVVCDQGYLRIQRAWREKLVEGLAQGDARRLIRIEGDVVVPLEAATNKHEYAARTLRPRIGRVVDDYLDDLQPRPVRRRADNLRIIGDIDLDDMPGLLAGLKIDASVAPVKRFTPGEDAARVLLNNFVGHGLKRYAELRGKPEGQCRFAHEPVPAFWTDIAGGDRTGGSAYAGVGESHQLP